MTAVAGGMKVAVICHPLRDHVTGDWITVPPKGYGGLQWAVAYLVDGYVERGHSVSLFGARGSEWGHVGVTVHDDEDIAAALRELIAAGEIDAVHNHARKDFGDLVGCGVPVVSTHHWTGPTKEVPRPVYLSFAHRHAAGENRSPVVRLGISRGRLPFHDGDEGYLLFMGLVAPWKGTLEAARFAARARRRLVVAGPIADDEYWRHIRDLYPSVIDYVGEVRGSAKLDLLRGALATMVPSQSGIAGPWGHSWVEPGSTIVGESTMSGTPVVSTDNGCLAEIVPGVGRALTSFDVDPDAVLGSLPSAAVVHALAVERWSAPKIVDQYVELLRSAESW